MSNKPTLFMVTDIETTMKKRIAFDIAWRTIDRKGNVYGEGSYVIREAFQHDVPFFAKKLGHYFDDAYNNLIKPANILEVRRKYNDEIAMHRDNGHRIIPCAYNAAFDFKYLPETLNTICGRPMRWLDQPAELLDIWAYWGASVPKIYRANASASGKYISTSAESAYRWEFCQKDFEEKHIAFYDCEIEADILVKALARKQKLTTVNKPKDFAGAVWKSINTRLGYMGKEVLPEWAFPQGMPQAA